MTIVPKFCLEPGCEALVFRSEDSRCRPHEKLRHLPYKDRVFLRLPRGGVCHLCGEPGADTLDHVVPLSRGGSNGVGNLRPAHRGCNSRKGGV